MKTKEEIGLLFQSLREEQGIKQEVLAARLGIQRATLSRVENGKSYPRLELAMAILDELGYGIEIMKR